MREFTILCGSTGSGKTSWLANLSANLLCQRVKHFVASVETGEEDFMRRVVSVLLDHDVNDGFSHSRDDVQRWTEQVKEIFRSDSLFLSLIDCRMSVDVLVKKLEYANETLGCKVAILDNLNFFLQVREERQQYVEMDRTIHEVVMFCKRNDIHVIMVMHPKKTDHMRVETEFDVKGSSTAVQEASNVFLFNRPEKKSDGSYAEGVTPFFRELKAAKLRRRGRYTGRKVIFDGKTPSYQEVVLV